MDKFLASLQGQKITHVLFENGHTDSNDGREALQLILSDGRTLRLESALQNGPGSAPTLQMSICGLEVK